MSNEASSQVQSRLSMKVIRKDGTVEHHDTNWSTLEEEEQKRLLGIPSIREWVNKQHNNKED